ncbi:MAG TPA: hypothetical protein VFU32_05155 [Ktedonobacterales bacterium]|nr:hypothetical protein [Ktedonobacterales bacterium]
MPDGVWETAKGNLVAIEVELSRKEEIRLCGILYSLDRQFAGIWYFTVPLIFTRLRRVLLNMKQPHDQQLKKKLSILLWDEEAEEWVSKGTGVQACEEPPAV